MKTPSTRIRRLATLGAAPVAIVAAGALVWQGSYAAFSADTRNIGNAWDTGSLTLTDDDSGSAMFQASLITPGSTGTKCIVVTATASVPGIVRTYALALDAGGLENNLMMKVEQGTGGSFSSCTGFTAGSTEDYVSLQAFATAHPSYETGMLPWTTTGNTSGETKSYRFTWKFDTTGLTQSAIDDLQGHAASINFEWEIQNS